MPQREFWTKQHPTEVRFRMHTPADDGSGPPHATVTIYDQAGAAMAHAGATLPPGFACWAMADAVRAGLEAHELAAPEDVIRAFKRSCAQWVRDAKKLLPQE